MKEFAKQILERRFFYLIEILTKKKLINNIPFGVLIDKDIKNFSINTIFDVGANIGQSVERFISNYDKPKIYSFEPIKSTYDYLEEKFKSKNINFFNLALSDKNEICIMSSDIFSPMNRIIQTKENFKETEIVKATTIENICSENNIKSIDYLKIDTEGYDLKVLIGAKKLLENKLIKFIEVEVSFNQNAEFLVSFDEIFDYLNFYKYRIFGFYDQVQDKKNLSLRRANCLFVQQ